MLLSLLCSISVFLSGMEAAKNFLAEPAGESAAGCPRSCAGDRCGIVGTDRDSIFHASGIRRRCQLSWTAAMRQSKPQPSAALKRICTKSDRSERAFYERCVRGAFYQYALVCPRLDSGISAVRPFYIGNVLLPESRLECLNFNGRLRRPKGETLSPPGPKPQVGIPSGAGKGLQEGRGPDSQGGMARRECTFLIHLFDDTLWILRKKKKIDVNFANRIGGGFLLQ